MPAECSEKLVLVLVPTGNNKIKKREAIKNAYEQKKKHPGILAQTDKMGKNLSRKHILIKLLQPTVLKPRINPV